MNKIAKSVKAAEAVSIAENAELVARARALVLLMREHRAEAEKLRRAPPQCVEAIQRAELFRIFVPREYGGFEVALRTAIDIYSEIGRGCASTAWTHMILATINLAVCLMSDQAQREVFGENPDARVAGVFVPRGKATPVEGGINSAAPGRFAQAVTMAIGLFSWELLPTKRQTSLTKLST